MDGDTVEARAPGDRGNWLMMEPGAAAPTHFCVLSYGPEGGPGHRC